MGLKIYRAPDPSSAFSLDGTFTNPLVNAFDGVAGSVLIRRYYVRNDDNTRSFADITVQPIFLSGDNIIDGTDGFNWKLIAGDEQPLEEQWELVTPGNSIVIPDIGTGVLADVTTYEPFWLRMTVPRGAPVKSHSGIKLRTSATEILVP